MGAIHAHCENHAPKQTNVSCIQIGGNYTHVNLKNNRQPSFHGNLGGMQGSYDYRPWNSFYGGLRVAWKEGEADGSGSDRSFVYVDVQERLGYTLALHDKNWLLSLFSGFGYRHFGQKLKQHDQHSILFDYNEFYIPLGFIADHFFNSWCFLGLNFIWMPQVYPTVKIVPLKGARWILKSTFSNILVELPLGFFLTKNKCYGLIFKPFYEYWEDGRSTAKNSSGNSLNLPGNVYNFWGAELNFAFSF